MHEHHIETHRSNSIESIKYLDDQRDNILNKHKTIWNQFTKLAIEICTNEQVVCGFVWHRQVTIHTIPKVISSRSSQPFHYKKLSQLEIRRKIPLDRREAPQSDYAQRRQRKPVDENACRSQAKSLSNMSFVCIKSLKKLFSNCYRYKLYHIRQAFDSIQQLQKLSTRLSQTPNFYMKKNLICYCSLP